MRIQALTDLYRCPEDFSNFNLSGKLSSDEGFFEFGAGIVCYGRSSAGTRERRASDTLSHLAPGAIAHPGELTLPFDPDEIIQNLRLERYVQVETGNGLQRILRKLYYLFRPYMGLTSRRRVQKFHARKWRESVFPRWPVDTTVEALCEQLLLMSMQVAGVDEVPFIWFWPNGATGCALMTHDVETEAGREACSELMDQNDAFGIKATFQIVPEKRYVVTSEFLDSIRRRGFEVAVQDLNHDGQLYDNRKEFLRRVELINRYGKEYRARGFRAAILYRKPEWYEALKFSFDMSIPNVAPLDPQRGGCCTVMPYFIGEILELPVTTVQDYTLFNLLDQHSIDLWKTQIELILRKHGLVSFIVHPDYVQNEDARATYRELLGHLRSLQEESGVWCALPSDVDRWWRERSQMSLKKESGAWRIKGMGSEQGVVAYARQVDGQLVYGLPRKTETVVQNLWPTLSRAKSHLF